jgi:malate dehydrogenase (oxaloacetate-decarboxylating)(NADP+)
MTVDKNSWKSIGREILFNAKLNKGSAFTTEERKEYHLHGLVPAAICTQEIQMIRVLENLRRKTNDIERYNFLMALLGRNERLFYKVKIFQHLHQTVKDICIHGC